MLAAWPVGTEHPSDGDSGEIRIPQIDADAVGEGTTRARCGVKAHSDARLTTGVW